MSPEEIHNIARAISTGEDDIATRHRAVQDALRFFTYEHLPSGLTRKVSLLCAELAGRMIQLIEVDDPELTRGLSRLLEAKDCFVRAAIVAAREADK